MQGVPGTAEWGCVAQVQVAHAVHREAREQRGSADVDAPGDFRLRPSAHLRAERLARLATASSRPVSAHSRTNSVLAGDAALLPTITASWTLPAVARSWRAKLSLKEVHQSVGAPYRQSQPVVHDVAALALWPAASTPPSATRKLSRAPGTAR